MRILNFKKENDFIKAGLELIEKVCRKKGIIRIALSGGSTPKKLYQFLAEDKKIPFERVEFYIVDERYVAKNHPDSNQKMISENLINPLKKKLKDFHYFDTSLPIEQSLNLYEKSLKKIRSKSFDLIILGIGHDGHTASLFPNSKALTERKLVAKSETNIFPVKDRLTITFPLILKSKKILILLKGTEKKEIIKNITNSGANPIQYPAKRLNKTKTTIIYLA